MTTLDLRHSLALRLCPGLGSRTLQRATQHISPAELFNATATTLREFGLSQDAIHYLQAPDWHTIDTLIQHCIAQHIQLVGYFDTAYPPLLKQISSAPLMLFCKGRLSLLSQPQIAIVGSRNATATGLDIAREFGRSLSNVGMAVTSGLARGIDGAAHQGALSQGGATLAVLGTGVDVIYPRRHHSLYQQVAEQGLLISEFLPGSQPRAEHFPRRNRIISGLSLGVLVVEAEIKSGSLITARYALEQNKEVFAVPGSIRNPLSQGCHYLLKEGAKLTERVEDILEEVRFFSENGLYIVESDKKQEHCPVLQHLGFEVTSVDTLSQRTQWPVERVLARLLDLELEDKVERVLDGYIKLARG
ncbi:DNA-processing protein DprA [Pseudoalteromonas ardens]|uniref:DNA protecting protein DprA n=1 Tax=Pseudoalteromonas rubra TaxID=43658 RepID=A0A0L0ENM8_9GAMM|nr:DNA-processing protein DprA [Pseudoalteromonas sp. R96]KNC66024.1 DNA protecting protein DprA [Pseudoalteromonas rubra]MDK1313911.1 DNA-processing protein DprA [Pseudoalteromonas sp. R96]